MSLWALISQGWNVEHAHMIFNPFTIYSSLIYTDFSNVLNSRKTQFYDEHDHNCSIKKEQSVINSCLWFNLPTQHLISNSDSLCIFWFHTQLNYVGIKVGKWYPKITYMNPSRMHNCLYICLYICSPWFVYKHSCVTSPLLNHLPRCRA